MKFMSLFSGIGGFDLAFKRVGMECVGMCEIDKAAQGVLLRHFPTVKLYDDVRQIGEATHERGSIDLICGGFPCQDLSVAGKRAGLAGERSGLWFEFARIIDELEPRWFVIENVPGLLSSNKGRDFATIIQWLAERGYGTTWRILDAQYFGLAQQRRRVFIVGHLGDGRAAEVLFESESGAGNTPARREEGEDVTAAIGGVPPSRRNAGSNPTAGHLVSDLAQITSKEHGSLPSEISQPLNTLGGMSVFDVAPTIPARTRGGGGLGTDFDLDGGLIEDKPVFFDRQRSDEYKNGADTVSTVSARDYKGPSDLIVARTLAYGKTTNHQDESQQTYIVEQNNVASTPDKISLRSNPARPVILASSLRSCQSEPKVSQPGRGGEDDANLVLAAQAWETRFARNGRGGPDSVCPPLKAQSGRSGKGDGAPMVGVRRLTPTECERLQGFPEIEGSFIMNVCSDHQKNLASAEIQNLKSQRPVGIAERTGLLEVARFAGNCLNISNQQTGVPALPSVLINCGERKVEIFNQGRCCSSVSFVGGKNSFPPLTKDEDFALLLAGASSILGRITRLGAEELRQNAPNSMVQRDGQSVVRLSGSEIMRLVNGAGKDSIINKEHLRSIISDPLNVRISDTVLTTLFYSVLAAISGYIPGETLKNNSFQIEINVSFGWTWGQSDSARYRQLGNAVAEPVAEWIANRIKMAEKCQQ